MHKSLEAIRHFDFRKGRSREDHIAAVLSYWTPERRAAAVPLGMPRSAAPPAQLPSFTSEEVPPIQMKLPPCAAMGRLFFNRGDQGATATAWLTDSCVAVTAAHAIFNPQKGYGEYFLVELQYSDGMAAAYLVVEATYIHADWLDREDKTADFAALYLAQSVASYDRLPYVLNAPGWKGSPVMALGYPTLPTPRYDYNGQRLWSCTTTGFTTDDGRLATPCDYTAGGSGSPWLIKSQGGSLTVAGLMSELAPESGEVAYGPFFDQRFDDLIACARSAQPFWGTRLADAGAAPVSLLSQGRRTYAGCNGYVYMIDKPGSMVRNDLKGYGKHPVSLLMAGSMLFVGMNGNLFALDPVSLQTKWHHKLSGSGETQLAFDGTYVYAAAIGNVIQRFDMDGNTASRILASLQDGACALSFVNGYLCYGLSGVIGCIRPADFTNPAVAPTYQQYLGEPQDRDTVILAGGADHFLAAMCNGMLTILDTRSGATVEGYGRFNVDFWVMEASILFVENRLYVACGSKLVCIDLGSVDTPFWRMILSTPQDLIGLAGMGGDHPVLYAATEREIVTIDPVRNAVIRRYRHPNDMTARATVTLADADTLFCAGLDGYIWASPTSEVIGSVG